MKRWFLSLLVVALLSGCGTSPVEMTTQSQAITATGQASLEDGSTEGAYYNRFAIGQIDDQLIQPQRSDRVHTISPGSHEVAVLCEFREKTPDGMKLRAGFVGLHFRAEAGVRYRANGERTGKFAALVWIERVDNQEPATLHVPAQLLPAPAEGVIRIEKLPPSKFH